jgi:hypothetical protein
LGLHELRNFLVLLVKLLDLVLPRKLEPLAPLPEDLGGGLVHFQLGWLLAGWTLLAVAGVEVGLDHLLA